MEIKLELSREDLAVERGAVDAGVELGNAEAVKAAPDAINEARFVEAVAVVGVVTVAWLAKRIVDDWLKDKQRGVQIDLRTKPATISRVAGVPRGFVVIIDKNGKATTQKATYEKPEDMLPMLQATFAAAGIAT